MAPTQEAPLGRILTAMVTPFAADGSLDLPAARSLARWLVEHGSDGLVLAGTTGEAPTLSDTEKLALWEAVVDEVGDEATIVAGTGTYDTAHSVHLTRQALRLGVDGFLVVVPYYNKPPVEGIVRHFAAIAQAASGRPIVAYNIPARVVLRLSVADLAGLRDKVPQVRAVKQAIGDLDDARDIVALGLTLYAGNDELLLPFLELGGAGGICVASHLVGEHFARIAELCTAGELDAARAVEAECRPVFEIVNTLTTNPIPVKAALNLLGHRVGGLRLPLVEAAEHEQAAIRGALERHGLLKTAQA
jgi:4-hydroxy-tetrahydrodipicolinate synthase